MRRSLLVAALGVGLLTPLAGCETTDPSQPEYWIKKLDNPTERGLAIRRLGEMEAKSAVPALVEAYKGGLDRNEIVTALARLNDKAATPVMLEALETGDETAAVLAGRTLREWEAREHVDTYLRVATDAKTSKHAKLAALELLAEYPDPKIEDALIPILEQDPDKAPIIFNGLAAEALGKLRSAKAVPGLITCMWLDDHLHRNEVPRCRLALTRIGPQHAVGPLIETLERKNRKVEARARKYSFDKGGFIEAKVAEVLADMADPAAVEPLAKAMLTFEDMPDQVARDPKKAQAFIMGGVQRVISIARALAAIGDERAVKPLVEIAQDKGLALEHKLAGVQQLAFLGSQAAIPGLVKMLAEEPHPQDPVSQGLRVQVALNLANLVDGTDTKVLDALEKQIKGIQSKLDGYADATRKEAEKATGDDKKVALLNVKAYGDWRGNYDEALKKLATARECQNDATCWGRKLAEGDQAVKMQAAYRLAQLKSSREAALAQLVPHLGNDDLVLRNVVLFGVSRLGDKTVLPALEKVRAADAEAAKKNKNREGAVYVMDLMIARLSHK